MPGFCIQPLSAEDAAGFAAFERDNRGPFEQFNEPHPQRYYSAAGLARAFCELLARQDPDRYVTRVAVLPGSSRWVGTGSLSVHPQRSGTVGVVVYQTDRQHWRQGVARALLSHLIDEAHALSLARVDALIVSDNTVSLHLLRRAGFKAAGWSLPAALLRGPVDCLQLSRPLRGDVGPVLSGSHVHLSA